MLCLETGAPGNIFRVGQPLSNLVWQDGGVNVENKRPKAESGKAETRVLDPLVTGAGKSIAHALEQSHAKRFAWAGSGRGGAHNRLATGQFNRIRVNQGKSNHFFFYATRIGPGTVGGGMLSLLKT